jgi:ABC-2 type transport system permease protein
VNQGDVIRKINFPKYVIILAGSVSAFINLLLNLVVIAVFMVINGVSLTWLAFLAPLLIIEVYAFALGIAFLLSTVFVKLRDINYIWEIVMQGLFYASAVIYPVALVLAKSELAAKLLLMNPVAQAIQDIRYVLITQTDTPTLVSVAHGAVWMLIPLGIVAFVLFLGAWVFKKQSPYFAENV